MAKTVKHILNDNFYYLKSDFEDLKRAFDAVKSAPAERITDKMSLLRSAIEQTQRRLKNVEDDLKSVPQEQS